MHLTPSVQFPKDLGTVLLPIHFLQGTTTGNVKSSLLEIGLKNVLIARTKEQNQGKEQICCHYSFLSTSQLNLLTSSTKGFIITYSSLEVLILFSEWRQNHTSVANPLYFPLLATPFPKSWVVALLLQSCLWADHTSLTIRHKRTLPSTAGKGTGVIWLLKNV